MIKIPNEKDYITERRAFHKEMLEISINQIACIEENILSAEQTASTTGQPLGIGYWTLKEQRLNFIEKKKAQERNIKVWEERLQAWEQTFEKTSNEVNSMFSRILECAGSFGFMDQNLLIAFQNVKAHDLSDQHTKNQCYIMLRTEFLRAFSKMASSAKLDKNSCHKVKEAMNKATDSERFDFLQKAVLPFVKIS